DTLKILPLERIVDCECDSRLARQILHYNYGSEHRVAACLSCGCLSCYYSMSDEPRGAGEVGGANFVVPIPAAVADWLDGFPRLLTLGPTSDDPIWAEAGTRCRDWERLQRLTDEQTHTTSGIPPGRRLALLPIPDTPFPALPDDKWAREFQSYISVRDLTEAPDDIPAETLVRLAKPGTPTHYVGVDRLIHHPGAMALLCDGLRESDTDEWATWLAVLRWGRPPRREVIAALGEGLTRFPLTPSAGWSGHVQEHLLILGLLNVLVHLHIPADWCEGDLRTFQERVGRRDWDLVAEISRTRRTLATV
ncbi:MAG: hypothetical protein H8F28_02045, partial [Fibrella sp.]|nr:hypothetical protein [Armatimonadota bacterium]